MDRTPTSRTVDQEAPIAVYVHIPKTAGSTLQSVLSQNYAPERSIRVDGPLLEQTCREFSEKYASVNPKLVYGHHPFGVHVLLRRPWLYFTLLRNPIDRLVSEYYYAFQYDKHRFVEEIRSGQLTLEKFVMLDHWFTGNLLTTYLSGLWGVGDQEKLERAKLNLRERFASFGVMERFDESLMLMASELGWDRLLYLKRNVTKTRPEGIDRNLRTRLEKKLGADMELYEYGCTLFRDRIERQPESFSSACEEYASKTSEISHEFSHLIHTEFNFMRGHDLQIDRLYESIPRIVGYLKETRAARRHPRCAAGIVEEVSLRSVSGWSLDSEVQDETAEVSVMIDDRAAVRVRADCPRPDLVERGFASPKHGFVFDFDPVLDDTRPHTLKLFHADSAWPLNHGEWAYEPRKGWRCIGKPRSKQRRE